MSTFKVDLDYNAAHIKDKILLLEAIYQEVLRQEKVQEDEDEQRRRNCRILKRQVKKDLLEIIDESEGEPVVEPVVVVVEPKKKSDKIICECGLEVVKRNMKRHCTSKNHIFQLELKKKKENTDLQI
jgi:hypothetical protein